MKATARTTPLKHNKTTRNKPKSKLREAPQSKGSRPRRRPAGLKRSLSGQLPDRKGFRNPVRDGKRLDEAEDVYGMEHLAGDIAHELRQPLSAIQNIAFYLRATIPSRNGAVLKHLKTLEQQTAIAGEILSSMLEFARSGKPTIAPTDLHAVLKNVLSRAALHSSSPSSRLRLKQSLARRLPPVLADPVHVDRILSNLIANGVESMEKMERRGKRGAQGTLSVATGAEGRQVVVRVADTGCGISPAQARSIFEPFFTTKQTGTGLGLALCRRMAEANGGSIGFQSRPGKGTTFELRLPKA